jgi:ribonucleoside-diphosphate reductase alpha chain
MHLRNVARTLEFGGGVGDDFSFVNAGLETPGIIHHLELWNAVATLAASSRSRRGALMGSCRCDHPDIRAFVQAKATGTGALPYFNLAVLMTDAFMDAVNEGTTYSLRHAGADGSTVDVDARGLFAEIARCARQSGEPGVLLIDTINRENNLWYREKISTTNPCGEVPLPTHGACVLGSINLAQLVRHPFTDHAELDFYTLEQLTAIGTRML